METAVQKANPVQNNVDSGKYIENKINNVMESIGFVMSCFVTIYFIMIIPSLFEMYNFFKESKMEVHFEEYWFTFLGGLFSYSVYKLCTTYLIKLWKPYISPIIVRENETPNQRMHRLGDYMYKTFYYTWSFVTLFYMTYNTHFSPKEFGGSLEITKAFQLWPYEVSIQIRIFYMFTLGHHCERLIYEIVHNRKHSTFYTMTFHHIVTIMLIFLSFFTRHLMFGIPVMLTHDFNDIFLNMSRFLRESLYPGSASFAFLIMFISWFYTRIYIYLKYVVYGLAFGILNMNSYIRRFLFVQVFFVPALISLLVLNLFWFFQIFRVFVWRFVKKDKNLPFEDFKTKKNK